MYLLKKKIRSTHNLNYVILYKSRTNVNFRKHLFLYRGNIYDRYEEQSYYYFKYTRLFIKSTLLFIYT